METMFIYELVPTTSAENGEAIIIIGKDNTFSFYAMIDDECFDIQNISMHLLPIVNDILIDWGFFWSLAGSY